MIEVKIASAKFLQHFSFRISPSYTHAPRLAIPLQPQYGAWILNKQFNQSHLQFTDEHGRTTQMVLQVCEF